MGKRTIAALIFSSFAGLFLLASLAFPWWFTTFDDREYRWTNCFIDGTCRNGNFIYKSNGGAQFFYDTTLVLMLLSLTLYLAYFHFVWFVWSSRFRNYPLRKKSWALASGALTASLLLVACIVFAVKVPANYGFSSPFGSDSIVSDNDFSWGLHVGWFCAILSLFFLVFSTVLIALKKASEDSGEGFYKTIKEGPSSFINPKETTGGSYHSIHITGQSV